MEREGIDLFTSVADTIARDGHIANKIGTFQMAILAKYFGIPYYVTSIPDQDKHGKDDIVIGMRDPAKSLAIGIFPIPFRKSRPSIPPSTWCRPTSFPAACSPLFLMRNRKSFDGSDAAVPCFWR